MHNCSQSTYLGRAILAAYDKTAPTSWSNMFPGDLGRSRSSALFMHAVLCTSTVMQNTDSQSALILGSFPFHFKRRVILTLHLHICKKSRGRDFCFQEEQSVRSTFLRVPIVNTVDSSPHVLPMDPQSCSRLDIKVMFIGNC